MLYYTYIERVGMSCSEHVPASDRLMSDKIFDYVLTLCLSHGSIMLTHVYTYISTYVYIYAINYKNKILRSTCNFTFHASYIMTYNFTFNNSFFNKNEYTLF